MKTDTDKIPAINGLRGVAILMVVYEHSLVQKISQKLNFYYLLDHGWTGVNLFFILSGFVLAKPYIFNYRSFTSKGDILWFYKHRYLRLYPLFIFSCLISFLFIIPPNKESTLAFIEAITCVSVFTKDGFYNPLNPVLWTLQIEILFSIIFPFIIIGMNKFNSSKFIFSIFLFSLVVRLFGAQYVHQSPFLNPIKDSIFGRLDDFMLGILICKLYLSDNLNFSNRILLIISLFAWLIGASLWDLRQDGDLPYFATAITNNIFQVAFGSALILGLKKGFFSRALSFYPLQMIGAMCFSIYIWHVLLLNKIETGHDVLDFALYLLAVLCVAAFTYRFIEFRKADSLSQIFLMSNKAEDKSI